MASIKASFVVAGKAVRTRPRTNSIVLGLVVVAGTGVGVYLYALKQWHAAETALNEGRGADARDRLGFCLSLWPRSTRVHLLAARAARISGDLDGAEGHLNRCLELDKGATEATQLEFLLLRVQAGEVDEVLPALLAYVETRHAETPLILETLSRAYMRNHRYGPALDSLNRWIQEVPEAGMAFFWRGLVLEEMHYTEEAMKNYRRALELKPDLADLRLHMAELFLEKSNPPEALPHLECLIEQFPERADVQARLGQCRFLQGKPEEARRWLEAAVEKLPSDSLLLVQLGKLELQENRPTQAEPWLRRAMKADPFDLEAQFALATCLEQTGRQQEAAAMRAACEKHKAQLDRANLLLKEMSRQSPTDAGAAYQLGMALLTIGQERLALYWLDQALQRDPRYQPAHQALAEHYESKGEASKAAAHRRLLTGPEQKAAAR